MNSTISTTAATSRPRIGALDQPRLLPSISARIRQISPLVSVTSPTGSRRPCSGSFDSRNFLSDSTTAPTPIGMLTRKIQRQESHDVSTPPASGPIATAAPTVAPQIPKAVPRSLPWNSCEISASAVANMIAPPSPWTPRPTIRKSESFARPQAAEAIVKRTIPITKSRLRPKRSASDPAVRTHAARASA